MTREVTVADPEGSLRLTRCPVCGYGRNAGAVEEFTAQTAAAITATVFSLHSGLAAQSEDEMLRRLLVFADSRQDTAFQAGYLRGRARALQVRRLITEVVRDRERERKPPASFNGLVEDVFRRGHGSGLNLGCRAEPPSVAWISDGRAVAVFSPLWAVPLPGRGRDGTVSASRISHARSVSVQRPDVTM